MRTGDVGYMDKDGFLWLTDRKKELIKYKGNQVAPAELEDIILQYPDVLECAVCATWDDKQETEIPVAYVNLKPTVAATEREATLREIRAFVDQRVASYKKLRGGVEYLAQIPRNPTGKILRRLLPAQIALEAKAAAAKRKGKL
jgi:acyl-coenzyme A synthetase/AMP-(fatty) acid ligase